MKNIKILAVSAIIALAAVACKKEEPVVETTLSVNPAELSYTCDGGTQSVTVTTNADEWKATSDQAWLTVTPANDGKTFAAVAAACSEVGSAARTATITVKADTKSATIKVSQSSEAVVFAVEGGTAEVPAAGATVNVKVQHNTTYSIGTLPEWIKNVSTKAVVTDNLKFEVAENTAYEARTADITFKAATGAEGKVTVRQAAAAKPSKLLSISSSADFLKFIENCATDVYTKDDVVTFANDIDLKGINVVEEIKKAEGFSEYQGYADTLRCTLDGQGHKILNYNNNNARYLAKTLLGTLQNIVIDASCTFTYGPNSGAPLVFENYGTMKNITNYANASMTGDLKLSDTIHMSPLLSVNRSVMTDCTNYGNFEINCTTIVNAKAIRLGGICASCSGNTKTGKPVMTNCVNHGSLTMKGANNLAIWYFGGIIGVLDNAEAIVENCTNDGEIKVDLPTSAKPVYIGGLAGQRNDGSVKNFTSKGNLTSTAPQASTVKNSTCIGGVFGMQKDVAVVGTVEGSTVNCKITSACVKSGSFDCAGMIVGGYLGTKNAITVGTDAAPVKVAGSICDANGVVTAVTVSENNFADYLTGALSKDAAHIFKASFQK